MVCNLNLALSHQKQEDFVKAGGYLKEAQQCLKRCPSEEFCLPMLILECNIHLSKGDHEFVKARLDEILNLCIQLNILSDYVQNVQEAAAIFCRLSDYKRWEILLQNVEKSVRSQNSVYYELVSMEMWMEYYSAIGSREKYQELCVKHTELYLQQKEDNLKERALTLDLKIALREKEEQRKIAEKKAQTDRLSGLANRYRLEQDSSRMIHRALKEQTWISVGLLDVDCFKQANDTYGHMEGDRYLQKVAEIVSREVKPYGTSYRFGGDEFVVLIPQGDESLLAHLGQSIQKRLKEEELPNINSTVHHYLTLSQGYVRFRPKKEEGLPKLLEYADEALYIVKNAGKDGYHILTKDEEK